MLSRRNTGTSSTQTILQVGIQTGSIDAMDLAMMRTNGFQDRQKSIFKDALKNGAISVEGFTAEQVIALIDGD